MNLFALPGLRRPACLLFATVSILFALSIRSQAQVVISEIHYDPIGGASNEFVEVYNAGTNAVSLSNWRFTAGITYLFASPTTLPAGGYLVVVADRTTFFTRYPSVTNVATGSFSGQLNNGGELLSLADATTTTVFAVTYNNAAPWPAAAAGLGSSLVLLDPYGSPTNPANWGASAEVHGNPGSAGALYVRDIVINEVLAHTDPPQEDAVELMNVTTNPINVSGWFLSDDSAVRKKYRFPTNSIIPAGGYLVVYQDQMTNSAGALIPFSISSKGDDIYLSQANTNGDLTRFVDEVNFEASKNGVSFGRYPNGTGDLIPVAGPTFGVSNPSSLENFRTGTGAANVGPYVHPVVINEIMYHPATSGVPMSVEFVELLNTSASTVQLYNIDYPDLAWSLTGGINYTFPTNLALGPGEMIVVTETNDIATFRTAYNVPTNVIVVGPWTGSLNNAGDTIRIRVPNSPEPPSNIAARYVADEVKFKDSLPWPIAADGFGGSMERIDPTSWGNTADNWHAAPNVATPGRTNTTFIAPGSIVISEIMAVNRHGLQDEDGDYSDWIELYNTRPYDVSLAGWYLTDKSSMPTQWTFPAVTIPARGYLVVFADMKNRTNDLTRLHTNFSLDEGGEFLGLYRSDLVQEFALDPYPPQFADVGYGFQAFGNSQTVPVTLKTPGRYMVPTNAAMLATNWNSQSFVDSAWPPGTNGFGFDTVADYQSLYETELRTQMLNKANNLFVRFPIAITNAGGLSKMELRLKFEDGFAAWVNGVLVASNNVPANAAWNTDAPTARNETLAVNYTYYDLSAYLNLLGNGTNVLAIQGLNNGIASSDFLLVAQLNILSAGGSTTTVGATMGYLSPATPASVNSTSQTDVVATPVLSNPGGVFVGSVTVTATCADVTATMRYTLDGSEPTETSTVYSGPLTFSSNTELRVRAFSTGKISSSGVGAVYRQSFLGINEILASNATTSPEIWDFEDFPDFIELYNAGTNAVDLSGYFLSDNLGQPFKWKIPTGASIPANGFFLVWADGEDSRPGIPLNRSFWPYSNFVTRAYHANFKLSSLSEEVGLFSPSGSRIDGVTFGPQSVDISYGRLPDGSATFGYFGEPTGGTNNLGPALGHNLYKSPAVKISPTNDALVFTNDLTIALTSATNVTQIRYTTNGAIPTTSSLVYTGAFTVTTSVVIRARAYAPDLHPGPIATRTYVRNAATSDLPVISIVIDPKLLYDPVVGIYSNTLKERQVPGNIQLFTTNGTTAFQIEAGFKIYGLNSFIYPQKPFTVYLNADYGTETLSYQMFPERRYGVYDRFLLRNGNDDWPGTYLRDHYGQRLFRDVTKSATQCYKPCAVFLNGAYFGIINIQEKMDEMYCVNNYNVADANIDFFEMDGTTITDDWILDHGNDLGWNALVSFLATNSMANPTNYAYVKSQVDIEDLVDYVSGQIFAYDSSWFHNRKWWRDRNPGGKWRWCVTDMDRAFNTVTHNTPSAMANATSGMLVYRELLNNSEFRAYAAQRIMAHLSSSFATNRTLPLLDADAASIRFELQRHIAKYASLGGIPSIGTWDTRIEAIRTYLRQRPANAMQYTASYFSTGLMARVTTEASGAGRVLANYVSLNTNGQTTFAAGLPVTMTAIPDIGQVFVRWDISTSIVSTLIATGSVWRYNDTVTNDVAGWTATNYDDSAWPSGPGQLGYGDGDEATVIGYGGNPSNKYITTYFRKALVLPNPAALTNIQMGLLRDDGAVVYVNGQEILRSNLPTGTVTYTTLALTNMTGSGPSSPENTYNLFNMSNSVFKAGTNLIAVEIHNFTNDNADAGFDMYLTASQQSGYTPTTNASTFVWMPKDGESLRAVYAPAGMSLVPTVITSNSTLTAAGSPWYATGDIFVPSNTTLIVEPGVSLFMPEFADIRVQGQLRMLGTTGSPVRIDVNTNANAALFSLYSDRSLSDTNLATRHWGALSFESATHTGELYNVTIRNATISKFTPQTFKSAINANFSNLFIDGLDLDESRNTIFVNKGSSTILQNSKIRVRTGPADGINIKRATYARVENCEFIGDFQVDVDAIDYDGVAGGIIRGNHVHDFLGINDDAIDLGELAIGIIVDSNHVERCTDKGVSVGQASTAIISRNQIRDVTLGVGIKDLGSYALVANNTFHKTFNGVALYEKNRGVGGGLADVKNCIFSENSGEPMSIDIYSTGTVAYSLSDTLPVAGIGNVLAQPQFLNAANNNFELQAGSAAIDAGNPTDPLDPDGSRIDIGALPFDWRAGHVMVSEIHYHPGTTNQAEYIELYNPGGTNLDLSGYRFTKGVDLTFAPGTILSNGTYLVVAASTNGISGVTQLILWTNGTLDNAGEIIELHDPASNEIDRVAYESFDPWPSSPDGLGPSLSVINPRRDNSLPSNWYASGATNGSPGRAFDNAFPGGGIDFGRGTSTTFSVSFDAVNNLLYTLEFTTNLVPATWQIIESGETTVNGQINLGHTPGSTNSAGVYRVRAITP